MRKIIMFVAVMLLYVTQVFAVSFDCKKAHTETEKTICYNGSLSVLDDELAVLYKKSLDLVSYKEELKQQQRDWIKNVRDACKDEDDCLQSEYEARIAAFNSTVTAASFVRKPGLQTTEREAIISAAEKMQLEKPYSEEKFTKKERTDRSFCTTLLDDLKTGQRVEFIEPIVTTDDYNNQILQRYLTKCPRLKPSKSVYWLPHVWRYLQENKIPKDEWEESGTVTFASYDFRLYHVAFDGKKKDEEFVLFIAGL